MALIYVNNLYLYLYLHLAETANSHGLTLFTHFNADLYFQEKKDIYTTFSCINILVLFRENIFSYIFHHFQIPSIMCDFFVCASDTVTV